MKNINEFENLLIEQTEIFMKMGIMDFDSLAHLEKHGAEPANHFYENYGEKLSFFQKLKNLPALLTNEQNPIYFNLKVKIHREMLKEIILKLEHANENSGPNYKMFERNLIRQLSECQSRFNFLISNNSAALEKTFLDISLEQNDKSLTRESKI